MAGWIVPPQDEVFARCGWQKVPYRYGWESPSGKSFVGVPEVVTARLTTNAALERLLRRLP